MKIAIVNSKNVSHAQNLSAEFWTLDSAKEENFNCILSEEEYELLGFYIGKIVNNVKFGISTNLLDKMYKYLKEKYVEKIETKIIFDYSENIQKNIVLKEATKHAKEYLLKDKEDLSNKLNQLIDLENRLK